MREIGGKARTVRELLGGTRYSIDYYQREYKWQTKQVRELIEDLSETFLESYKDTHDREAVQRYEHYFLGSVILSAKDKRVFIIDGQQRLTTITPCSYTGSRCRTHAINEVSSRRCSEPSQHTAIPLSSLRTYYGSRHPGEAWFTAFADRPGADDVRERIETHFPGVFSSSETDPILGEDLRWYRVRLQHVTDIALAVPDDPHLAVRRSFALARPCERMTARNDEHQLVLHPRFRREPRGVNR